MHGEISADDIHASVIHRQWLHWIQYCLAVFLLRGQAGLLHDGIHPASGKVDVGEQCFQFTEDAVGITAQKVMQTYQIDLHTAGTVRKLPDNIRHSLNGHILQIPVQKILFFQHDG